MGETAQASSDSLASRFKHGGGMVQGGSDLTAQDGVLLALADIGCMYNQARSESGEIRHPWRSTDTGSVRWVEGSMKNTPQSRLPPTSRQERWEPL